MRRVARRAFTGGAAASLLAARIGGRRAQAAAPDSLFAYVGSYTPSGAGIGLYRVDRASGALTLLETYANAGNPTWLALDPARNALYATSEIRAGVVTAYAVDRSNGRLTERNRVSSLGVSPAHVSVHPSGRFVFVANYYDSSVAVFPVGGDGSLGAATDVKHLGGAGSSDPPSGAVPGNFAQSDHASAHAHMVAADPSGRFVIVNDAGLDRTFVWAFDLDRGRLRPAATPSFTSPAGSAPRHFAFHPNGRRMYNLLEHACELAVYAYDGARGSVRLLQTISLLPAGFAGSSLASEVVVSADGRFVYAASRLHDAIVTFGIAADGRLTYLREDWTRADYPRSIGLDTSGTLLFACNQRGDAITSFRIDPAAGSLAFSGAYTAVGSPAAIVFFDTRLP